MGVASEMKRRSTNLGGLRMMGGWMEVGAYMDIGVKLIIGFPLSAYWGNWEGWDARQHFKDKLFTRFVMLILGIA